MIARPAVLVVLVCVAFATPARAQYAEDAPRGGSWEVSGGVRWAGSTDLGERVAEQTRNPTTGSGSFQLFVADMSLESAPGGDIQLAFYLSPQIALEAGARFAQPRLRVALSGDAEEAEDGTAEETISQYQFDGSLVLHFTGLTFAGGRAVPFVLGGAGHIRDLHQGDELVETGSEFHGGGGLKWWFGSGQRRLGFRVEVRATSRAGGFTFGDDRRTVTSGGVAVAYVF